MRLTLLTIGSRGDVQPMLALGRELANAGHEAVVATHPKFEPLVARVGLLFEPIAEGTVSAGTETPEGRAWVESGSRYLPTWVAYLMDARSVARERLADALRACTGSDAIIATDLATLLGWQMADHLGVPLIRANLNMPASLNGLHGALPNAARRAAWRAARTWLDPARRSVGLPALPVDEPLSRLDEQRMLALRAYSPTVGPLPLPARDWIKVTGYWFLEERLDPEPSQELNEFVAAGTPPVCIDFGSMGDADPDRTARWAIEVLERVGHRGILIYGRFRKSDVALPDTVFGVESASHTWLFERCAAVVHHSGAGTVAAALRAGVPSVPVPHTEDQARWARRIHQLGAASAPIPWRKLSPEKLYAGVAAATQQTSMRLSAAALAEIVTADDGTARALEIIEAHLDRSTGANVPTTLIADKSEA